MGNRRIYHLLLALLIAVSSIMPANTVRVSANTESIIPVNWPSDNNWYSYQDGIGNPILDIAGEVSPSDTDITSGVDNGYGKLPSVYVAADEEGKNLFVRYRMKSNPYDRKGGFLSTAWVVKIIKDINGVPTQVATVGLDGKSPSVDYVYVTNGDGSKVKTLYQTGANTDNKSEPFPGARITPADNGHYFLDFQVPISEIAAISDAQDILGANKVMLYFGTSKAANLSVINKEWMSEDHSYNNLREISIEKPGVDLGNPKPTDIAYPTITIDTLTGTKDADGHFTSNAITVTGSVSEDSTIAVEVNGTPLSDPTINVDGQNWSLNLTGHIPDAAGNYQVDAYIVKGGVKVKTVVNFVISKSTVEGITIYGDSQTTTTLTNPLLKGNFKTANQGNNIFVFLENTELGQATKVSSNTEWQYQLVQGALKEGLNNVRVEIRNNKTVLASATQQINYIPENSTIKTPISVSIESITPLESATPTISGLSTGAKSVEVQAIDPNGNVKTIEVIIPSTDGTWSTFIERPLSTGNYSFKAIAINEAGDELAIATDSHTVNQLAITIDNGAGPITINDNTPILRGGTNAPDNSDISVALAGTTYNTTSKNGRWEVAVPLTSPIINGNYSIDASVTSNGNTVTASQNLTIDATTTVAITTPINNSTITDTKQPVISGTAEVGASVDVVVTNSKNEVVLVKSFEDGENWSYTPESDLKNDTYSINALAVDLYGNMATATSTFTIGSGQVVFGELTLIESKDSGVKGDKITNSGNPELKFTGESGLTIILEGTEGNPLTINTHYSVVENNGVYTITLLDANSIVEGNQPFGTYQSGTQTNNPRNTADGTYSIKAEKVGVQTETIGSFVIDTTSPATIPTVASGTSTTSTPTISGTATLESGDELTVTIDGVTYTVGDGNLLIEDTNWTLTIPENNALSEGMYNVVATVTDVAGNQINDTTANELTVNMTITVGGLLLTEPTDSGVKGDFVTNAGNPELEFTGESGLTIIIEGPEDIVLTQNQHYSVLYSNEKYKVTLIDAKPLLEGEQSFGTYKNGIPTGNPTNTADGTYKIKVGKSILQPVQIGTFDIRTSILPPQISVSTDVNGKVTVRGAIPRATVLLYNKDGEVVNTVVADDNGTATFLGVPGNIDYYVTQTYEGLTSTPSNKINIVQVFGSEDGAKTVTVLGATPGETVILYNKANAEVARANADDTGKFIFKEVSPDKDYYVTQMINTLESSPSNKVNVYPRISVRFSEGDIWESITKEAFVIKESATDIITWKSSNEEVLKVNTNRTTDSVFPEYIVEVNRQNEDVNVILTAETIKEGKTIERTFLLVVKGLNGNETKTTLPSNNEVKVNGQKTSIDVTRTELTRNGVTQYIDKLILRNPIVNGNPVVIDFADKPQDSNSIADEITAEIQVDALSQMVQEPLTIATPEGSISMSEQSLQDAARRGIDLFYRIVPLRTEPAKQRVINEHGNLMAQEAGNKTYQIVGIPREIVTNYTGISTDVILPLKGSNIPVDQVNNLRVLIEHSDEERIVRIGKEPLDGEIIYVNGQPVGIKFTVAKFSTFTIFQVVDQPNIDGDAPVTPSLPPEPKVDFHKAYMRGYPDGMFKPEDDVTRGQMAAMLARNLGYDESVKVLTNPYLDVKASNWAAKAIQFIEDEGLMVGYPDGTFRPDAPITRAEMATIVTRIKKIEVTKTSIGTFKDNSNHWATSVIEANKKIGILVGYPDGTFRPDDNLSRAEATKVVNRIFERGPLYGITKPNWPDVPTTHWAYHEIEEASQDHFFTIRSEAGENIVK